MVRNVADRAFLPARSLLEEVGDMMILTGRTIMSALRPPYPYGGEFVNQFLFALKLCWFPLLVSTIAFGYGAPGLQAANFLVLFGAVAFTGLGVGLASLIRSAEGSSAVVNFVLLPMAFLSGSFGGRDYPAVLEAIARHRITRKKRPGTLSSRTVPTS